MYIIIGKKSTGDAVLPADTNQLMDNLEAIVNGVKSFSHLATTDTTVVVNLNTDMLDSAHKSTDATFAANSDNKIPTEKAIIEYIDNLLFENDVVFYKGEIDCTSNPNYPEANAGYLYNISAAGKVGGSSGKIVAINNFLLCKVDDSPSGNEEAVGTNWVVSGESAKGNLTASDPFTITNGTGAIIGTGTYISVTSGYYFPTESDKARWDTGGFATSTGDLLTSTGLFISGGTDSLLGGDVIIGIESGYYLPTNADKFNWDVGSIVISGDLTTSTGLFITNGENAVTSSTGTKITIAPGFYLPETADQSNWNQAYTDSRLGFITLWETNIDYIENQLIYRTSSGLVISYISKLNHNSGLIFDISNWHQVDGGGIGTIILGGYII